MLWGNVSLIWIQDSCQRPPPPSNFKELFGWGDRMLIRFESNPECSVHVLMVPFAGCSPIVVLHVGKSCHYVTMLVQSCWGNSLAQRKFDRNWRRQIFVPTTGSLVETALVLQLLNYRALSKKGPLAWSTFCRFPVCAVEYITFDHNKQVWLQTGLDTRTCLWYCNSLKEESQLQLLPSPQSQNLMFCPSWRSLSEDYLQELLGPVHVWEHLGLCEGYWCTLCSTEACNLTSKQHYVHDLYYFTLRLIGECSF